MPRTKRPTRIAPAPQAEVSNSLSAFATGLSAQGVGIPNVMGTQLSQLDTLWLNNRWGLLSNMRQLLSELYVEHGIIQTLVDQPVEDAFRSGFDIRSAQLDGNDVELLWNYLERHRVIETMKSSCKWARLYGGGATMVITDQDPAKPLNVNAITPKSRFELKAVDMWELYYSQVGIDSQIGGEDLLAKKDDRFYDYYGHRIHESRILPITGKEAPSFVRPRLRGWGMSELEKIVRTFNQYMKNQNVVFELLDEAKVDVYKISGLNTALMDARGTEAITNRVQAGNMIKNYLNALTMDTKDEYEQKQIQFTGLGEMLVQIRQGIAADLKMPITKLFGISAAGFNSGEDDIENYNSMIESEIRSKIKYHVIEVVGLCCQHLFGFIPQDLTINFNSLRILDAVQQEEVKTKQFDRVQRAYESGTIDHKTYAQAINKDMLLPIEIDENNGPQFDGSPQPNEAVA